MAGDSVYAWCDSRVTGTWRVAHRSMVGIGDQLLRREEVQIQDAAVVVFELAHGVSFVGSMCCPVEWSASMGYGVHRAV